MHPTSFAFSNRQACWGVQFTGLVALVLRILFSHKVWQLQQIKTKNHNFHY